MNALTDILNTALVSQGSLPMDGRVSCPCCKDGSLDRDDMADERHFNAPYLRKLELKYGPNVCFDCADAHQSCDFCGVFLADDEAHDGPSGEHYCEDCVEDGHDDLDQRAEAALHGHFS